MTCKTPRRLASGTISGGTQPHYTGTVPENPERVGSCQHMRCVSVAVAVPVRLAQCARKSTNCTPCYTVLSGTWLTGLSFHLLVEGRTNWCTVLLGWLPVTASDVSVQLPLNTLYSVSQTERFYCVTSYLTGKLSKLRSFEDNIAGLRTILSSRLSHTELRSSLRESHSFLSLLAHTTMASSQGTPVSSTPSSR